MDIRLAAAVVLSAAGQTGADDLSDRAADLVGPDMVGPAGRELAGPWLADGGQILVVGEPGWPKGLAVLGPATPCALWVRGDLTADPQQVVSVVGARRCSAYGRGAAEALAAVVAASGRHVVSGGALGIDEAAHRGALEAGGRTVLFAAGGAGRVYPPSNAALFGRAQRAGAVVWEYAPGAPLTKRAFLHRNRLIAAVSAVTVVVEAADRSGALNTGRTAADLGRLVLGVPGRIDSPASAGVHRAIADGWAALVMSPSDLAGLLGGPVEGASPRIA